VRPLSVVGGAVVDAGERTSWLTTTRSAPLMMKVPWSVERKSPCRPAGAGSRRLLDQELDLTYRAGRRCPCGTRARVWARRIHSPGNGVPSTLPVKSLIGLISSNSPGSPCPRNQSNEVSCSSIRLGISRTSGSARYRRRGVIAEAPGGLSDRQHEPSLTEEKGKGRAHRRSRIPRFSAGVKRARQKNPSPTRPTQRPSRIRPDGAVVRPTVRVQTT